MQVSEFISFSNLNKSLVWTIFIIFSCFVILFNLIVQGKQIYTVYESNAIANYQPKMTEQRSETATKSWPLFGILPESLESMSMPWTLVGILRSSDPRFSSVVIETSGVQKQIFLGSVMPDGSVLEQIDDQRIIVKKAGKMIEIPLSLKKFETPPPSPNGGNTPQRGPMDRLRWPQMQPPPYGE